MLNGKTNRQEQSSDAHINSGRFEISEKQIRHLHRLYLNYKATQSDVSKVGFQQYFSDLIALHFQIGDELDGTISSIGEYLKKFLEEETVNEMINLLARATAES